MLDKQTKMKRIDMHFFMKIPYLHSVANICNDGICSYIMPFEIYFTYTTANNFIIPVERYQNLFSICIYLYFSKLWSVSSLIMNY